MEENLQTASGVLGFEVKRSITSLFKHHLQLIEDIRYNHQIALDNLKKEWENSTGETVPMRILKDFNYLDFDRFSQARKRTLDRGNEAIRDLEKILENFEISLKDNNKLIGARPNVIQESIVVTGDENGVRTKHQVNKV